MVTESLKTRESGLEGVGFRGPLGFEVRRGASGGRAGQPSLPRGQSVEGRTSKTMSFKFRV